MGNLKARDHLENLVVHERIALTWISKNTKGVGGMDYSGSGRGQVAGCNEPASPIKKQ